jgi:hypothetical protein
MVPKKPGRPCKVCTSEARKRVDTLVVRGVPIAQIARQFPDFTRDNLYRHAHKHIPPEAMRRSIARLEEAEVAHGTGLALEARKMRMKAIALLLKAEQSGDLATALRGIREANACLVTEARLLGELDGPPATTINVESQPQVVVVLPSNGRESPEIIGRAGTLSIPFEGA